MVKNINKENPENERAIDSLDESNASTAVAEKEHVSKVNPLKDSGKDLGYNLAIVEDRNSKVDLFYIPNKDLKYEYRFLNIKDSNLSLKTHTLLHAKGGWQICPKNHCLEIGINEDKLDVDGHYRVIDTILSRIPKELYEKKEKYKKEKAQGQIDRVNNLIKKGDPGAERGIHESFRGLQTGEALGMK